MKQGSESDGNGAPPEDSAEPVESIARRLRTLQTEGKSVAECLEEVDRERGSDGAPEPDPDEPPTIVLRSEGEEPLEAEPGERTPASVAVGDLLKARFSLVQLIGEGGMSRVYKAVDLRRVESGSPDTHVAIKVLTLALAGQPGAVASLQREAQKLQQLTHPNIVRVFDCDRDGAVVFMTMEYLTGRPLSHILRTSQSSVAPALERDRALRFIAAVGEALAHAHLSEIVHGDLKPGNVILTDSGEIKVIDFGVSRWVTEARLDGPGRGPAGPAGVTPRYASPQLRARHPAQVSDDVYALAGLAYELLAGAVPFGPHGALTDSPAPPAAGLSAGEYAALKHALEFDPSRRTPTVRKFLEEFLPSPPAPQFSSRAAWSVGTLLVAVLGLAVGWYVGRPVAPRVTPVATAPVAPPAPAPAPVRPAPGTVLHDCPACPLVTVVPAGVFQQGADEADPNALPSERPSHRVVIAAPFGLSTTEVTVAEFREFAAATRRPLSGCDVYDGRWHRDAAANWETPGFAQTATHPVTCVSWQDASDYAVWLSARSGHRYRLPSASEWEYAARAGTTSPVPWGASATDACAMANVADQSAARRYPGWTIFGCTDGFVATAPVGSFQANGFGLKDLLGNVFEWTLDCWHADYRGAPADGTARLDPPCAEHEVRGGSWFSSPQFVRAAYRDHFMTDYRTSTVGIRVVRELRE